MTELVVTRGIPASGKTTFAKEWVADNPNRSRVCRDDIRAQLYGAEGEAYAAYFRDPLLHQRERVITNMETKMVAELLRLDWSVVIDATHIKTAYVRRWRELAAKMGVGFDVVLFDTPLDECLRRDALRPWPIGEKVISEMHMRLRSALRSPIPEPVTSQEPLLYEGDPALPEAWIVDVDGTLALMNGRSPYDTTRYHEDTLNEVVANLVSILSEDGAQIVVMSGRDERYREATRAWLAQHHVPFDALFMRTAEDIRNDAVIKLEMFFEHVAPRWNVVGSLDDRDRVVEAWRSIGLTCLQVAPGDF